MKKKFLLGSLVALFVCILVSVAGYSQASVRVGYIDYDGFIQPNVQGGFTGYGAEYLDKISKQTGWRYLYVQDTWENCLKRLQTGEIDLLCTAQYTSERAKSFNYSAQPAGLEYGILYVRPDNTKVFYNDHDSFDGMRVGLLKGSFQTEEFARYAAAQGFSYTAKEYATDEAMTQALIQGDVDAIAAGSLARKTELKPVAKFSIDEFFFITQKSNTALMQDIDHAMNNIKLEDPYFDAQLYQKYYGDSIIASHPMFTREEGEFIRNISSLRVAYREDWFPVEYMDNNGMPQGVSIEVMKRLALIGGITFEFVPYPSLQITDAFEDPEIDIVSSQCVMQKSDPANTEPYVDIPVRLIGNIDNNINHEHPTLALEESSRFLSEYLLRSLPTVSIKYYGDREQCLMAVAQNQVDYTVSGNFVVNQIIQNKRFQHLILIPAELEQIPLRMRVSASSPPEVRSLLDKCIAFLPSEAKEQAVRNMDTAYAGTFATTFWEKNSYMIVVGGVATLLLLCGVALWCYFMEKKKLEYAATHDVLTSCLTGEQFKKEAAIKIRCNGTQDYYLMKFDVLHLKYINQKYGTKTGDLLLQMLAARIHEIMSEQEVIGRIIDDNFGALFFSKNVHFFEQELLYQVDKIKCQLKIDAPVIIKAGAYKVHDITESVSMMLDKAAIAHKQTKQNPKLDLLVYNENLYQKLIAESQIESEMLPALANGEFQVYLQPQIDLKTMRIAAAEALIRWVRSDGAVVEPGSFIPLFERNGFVERIDFYVLEQVARWLRMRIESGLSTVPISVNQSRFLLSNPRYVADVEQILAQYDVPNNMIALELTESMCLENADLLVVTMEKLHDLQVQLSIDDFGSGYSSLNLLSEIPSDELKIDRGFLGGSTGSVPKRQIIAKVVELAKTLHIRVVCEGVETKEQESFLQSVHCDLAQGFLYSRPIPIEQFEKLLDNDWDFKDCLETV